jgi:hypothetical protein
LQPVVPVVQDGQPQQPTTVIEVVEHPEKPIHLGQVVQELHLPTDKVQAVLPVLIIVTLLHRTQLLEHRDAVVMVYKQTFQPVHTLRPVAAVAAAGLVAVAVARFTAGLLPVVVDPDVSDR